MKTTLVLDRRPGRECDRRRRVAGRWLVYAALSLLTLPVLSALRAATARATEAVVVVKMLDMPASFDPAEVTITTGGTVKWENVGSAVHHASSDPSHAIKSEDVANPPGGKPFDSGFLRPGESFSHTFTKPGVYKYVCAVHEASGMVGTVVVK